MLFCTQCGKQLLEGQACECVSPRQFCTKCGIRLIDGQLCPCLAPPPDLTPLPAPPPLSDEPQPGYGYGMYAAESDSPLYSDDEPDLIHTDYAAPITGEAPIKQYNIAHMRGWLRSTQAQGHLHITNLRVIFKAEKRGQVKIQREVSIMEVAGVEAAMGSKTSIPHLIVGLVTVLAAAAIMAVAAFMGGWAVTNVFVVSPSAIEYLRQTIDLIRSQDTVDVSQLSLIAGLVAGFGGATLYFLLRDKYWFRTLLLGCALGGFFVVGLSGGLFALALLLGGVAINLYGLFMYARVQVLSISLYTRGGAKVNMCAGYPEATPTPEAVAMIYELGAIIADMQG